MPIIGRGPASKGRNRSQNRTPAQPIANVIGVSPTSTNMTPGSVQVVTAAVQWDATNSPILGVTVSWGTSNAGVATVSADSGDPIHQTTVTAVGSGTAIITATGPGGIQASFTLTVQTSAVYDAIAILTPDPVALTEGQSTVVDAQLTLASVPVSGQTVTWQSSNTGVVTVSADSGDPVHRTTVTSVAVGSASVTATGGVYADSVTVNVTAASADFPNLPAGYALISDVTFNDPAKKPIASTSVWDVNRWQITRGAGRISIGSATGAGCPSAPFGDTVLRGLFPFQFNANGGGGWSGTSPFVMTMQFASPEILYQNVYYAVWVCEQTGWVNSTGDPCPGPKFGFWNPSATTNGPKLHQFLSLQTDTPYTVTENRFKMAVSSVGPAGLVDWQVLSSDNAAGYMSVGVWHKVEILTQSGTPGVADGRVRLWLDGSLKFDRTDVIDPPGAPKPGYRGIDWNPTVCGYPWPADQYMCIARWAVFVSN